MSAIESRFAKELKGHIIRDMEEATKRLCSGVAIIPGDASATGMNCARYIGHIAGLQYALNAMEMVEDDMFGKIKDKKETMV